jgi:hypothetical protein
MSPRILLLGVLLPFLLAAGFAMSPETAAPFKLLCSGSMEPILSCKGRLYGNYLNQTDKENMQIGDIIAYDPRPAENPQTWIVKSMRLIGAGKVVHRIVRKEGSYYVTMGDANMEEDDVMVKPAMIVFKITKMVLLK